MAPTCLSFLGLAVVLSLIRGLASLAASSASDALDFFPNVGIVIPDCKHRMIVMQWSGVVGVNKQSSAISSHVIAPCHHHAIVQDNNHTQILACMRPEAKHEPRASMQHAGQDRAFATCLQQGRLDRHQDAQDDTCQTIHVKEVWYTRGASLPAIIRGALLKGASRQRGLPALTRFTLDSFNTAATKRSRQHGTRHQMTDT